MQFIRNASTVGLYTILGRIIGFFRDILMASYVGTGQIMDALVIAIKIPSFIRRIFAEGALNAAFIPLFTKFLTQKQYPQALYFSGQILSFILVSTLSITVLSEWCMPTVLSTLFLGLQPENLSLTVQFTRITFPFIILITLTALYSSVLSSLDRFQAAASSPIIGGIFIVSVLLYGGPTRVAQGQLVALAILGSGVAQLVWVMVPCWVLKWRIVPQRQMFSAESKNFIKRMIPSAIGSSIVQVNLFIDTMIASFLPTGTVSYLYYADRLHQLPLSVIGTAISSALLPSMARQLQGQDTKQALSDQNRAIEFCMLIALPATIGLIVLAYPLIVVLFQRNAFQPSATLETVRTLKAFATGLPAYIFVKIFNTNFFARGDTQTPTRMAIFSIIVNIILNIVLLKPLKHVGIAIATSLSAWISTAILGFLLYRKGYLAIDLELKQFFIRLITVSALSASLLKGLIPFILPFLEMQGPWWQRSGILGLLIIGGGTIFSTMNTLAKMWFCNSRKIR